MCITFLDENGEYNYLPSVYLKPDVSIIDGYGTFDNPYELNISYDAEKGLTICTNETNVQYLRANYNGGNPLFRFYKEASKTTGVPVALYKLEQNYRSTKKILERANLIIKNS